LKIISATLITVITWSFILEEYVGIHGVLNAIMIYDYWLTRVVRGILGKVIS